MKFKGHFTLNKQLTPTLHEFLNKLSQTKRIGRVCDNDRYGFQGEFYVENGDLEILWTNVAPATQPSPYCCWKPTEDGLGIEWDRTENFPKFVEWINYIINKILIPNGYSLTGDVQWQGKELWIIGTICIDNNFITVETFGEKDSHPTVGLDMRLDYVYKDNKYASPKKSSISKADKKLKIFEDVLENYVSTKLLKTILLEVEAKCNQK